MTKPERVETPEPQKEPVWIIYDERAAYGDAEDAAVFESFGVDVAKNDDDARRYAAKNWRGYNYALYRYDLDTKKREASNERLIRIFHRSKS